MVLSDSFANRKLGFAGLPELTDPSAKTKRILQFTGRVLLVLLFFGFLLRGGVFSWVRIIATVVGLLACIMVAVGFKAKYSAVILLAMLSVFNVVANNFWGFASSHPHHDFRKYIPLGSRDLTCLDMIFSKRFRLWAASSCLSIWDLGG
jgi:ER-derived vesicles protein